MSATDDWPPDPWGLTPAERRALQYVIDYESNKAAANALGVGVKTVECLILRARTKMERGGVKIKRNGRFKHLIEWDRLVRKPLA